MSSQRAEYTSYLSLSPNSKVQLRALGRVEAQEVLLEWMNKGMSNGRVGFGC